MERGATPSTPADRAPRLPRTRSHATTKKRGTTDKVEEVIEPTIRIVGRPSIQLGLDTQYPRLSREQLWPRIADVHRRAPDVPTRPLRTRCSAAPCDRLSRPRTA